MSKISEKLINFENDLLVDVNEERSGMIAKVESEISRQHEAEEMRLLGEAYERIQSAMNKIDQEKSAAISKKAMENRSLLLGKRNEIIQRMQKKAIDKLTDFKESDSYMQHLLTLVDKAKEELSEGDLVISIDFTDRFLEEQLREKTGCEVTVENKKVSIIGGCIVFNRTKQTIVDYSFKGKLDEIEEEFIYKCKLDVE